MTERDARVVVCWAEIFVYMHGFARAVTDLRPRITTGRGNVEMSIAGFYSGEKLDHHTIRERDRHRHAAVLDCSVLLQTALDNSFHALQRNLRAFVLKIRIVDQDQ